MTQGVKMKNVDSLLHRDFRTERAAKCAATKVNKVYQNKKYEVCQSENNFLFHSIVWRLIEVPVVKNKIGWIN
jgi:hypothetical protein